MFCMPKKKIYSAYISKHNSNHEKQVILSMMSNGEGWHYLAVKKLLALLKGIMSKHHYDFYCLNCLHPFRSKYKLKSHIKVCLSMLKLFVAL